ncbi:hypothetical protein CEXT_641641 [Caerostris extrusa]|uniref:Uncharacterized protein n=1 Tax=Caerostris extrusa TaxID=172846 RepID=A0AAV4V3P7_CAEEX|nr:hypothetical protein CEXT_641641 [Caerostris extrusa]
MSKEWTGDFPLWGECTQDNQGYKGKKKEKTLGSVLLIPASVLETSFFFGKSREGRGDHFSPALENTGHGGFSVSRKPFCTLR